MTNYQDNKRDLINFILKASYIKHLTPAKGTNYFGRLRLTKKGARHAVNPPGTKIAREANNRACTMRGRVSKEF